MSSRRSLRATSKPNPSSQQPSNSSTSSISSGRARSVHKAQSPRSSVVPRSLSSAEAEDTTRTQSRRTRSQDDARAEAVEPHNDEDDEEGEEEVTRCICEHLEYPGMPLLPNTSRASSKSNGLGDSVALQEDAGGLFIQCDVCKVWQHGGCVGIMDEAMSPDEYFCELCRKEMHKITTSTTGQKYSRYLPVQARTSSMSSPVPPARESKRPKDGKSGRGNAESLASKRRLTMNSRDSAYDEAEELRRAIEESKREAGAPGAEGSLRRGKRSRSDSEQRKEDTKRQRTTSRPSSSQPESKAAVTNVDSLDEDDEKEPKLEGAQKIRGAAARNHRAKEHREHEALQQREQERADAAGRRKARSERRRGEDSDPSEEPLTRTASTKDLPPPLSTVPKASHKKNGRPPARKSRVGRNQYTRDRDNPSNAALAASPARSMSGSEDATPHLNGVNSHSPNNKNGNGKDTAESGGKARLKHLNPVKATLSDMKRRAAALLDFISHTQVEMAARSDFMNPQSSNPTPPDSGASSNGKDLEGSGAMLQKLLEGQGILNDEEGEDFLRLSSVEMMEVLTRRLMRWQAEYAN